MSKLFYERMFVVPRGDLEQLPMTDADVEGEPGEMLPSYWPTEGVPIETLIAQEDCLLGLVEDVVEGVLAALRVHPKSRRLSLSQVVLNAAVLAKITHRGDDATSTATWAEIAQALGVCEDVLYRHQKAIKERINIRRLMGSRQAAKTKDEKQKTKD